MQPKLLFNSELFCEHLNFNENLEKKICKVNVLIKTIISITTKSHFHLAYVYENFCE